MNPKALLRRTARKVVYRIKYGVPLFQRDPDIENIPNVLDMIGPIRSCAIIGRGASVKACNPLEHIQQCDFKVIMNRVEIESLTDFLGDHIDAQIAQPPGGVITVLPKNLVEQFGLRFLISNKLKTSDTFKRFYSAYYNRGVPITCVPDDSEMKYDFCKYKYPHRTQCGSLLKILYNIDTLEKIVFAGVDFFRFDYVTQGKDTRVFPKMLESAQEDKGDPLFKFIVETVQLRNKIRPLTVYFPYILKPLLDFPSLDCFRFYGEPDDS